MAAMADDPAADRLFAPGAWSGRERSARGSARSGSWLRSSWGLRWCARSPTTLGRLGGHCLRPCLLCCGSCRFRLASRDSRDPLRPVVHANLARADVRLAPAWPRGPGLPTLAIAAVVVRYGFAVCRLNLTRLRSGRGRWRHRVRSGSAPSRRRKPCAVCGRPSAV